MLCTQFCKCKLASVKQAFVAQFQLRDDQQCHKRKCHKRGMQIVPKAFAAASAFRSISYFIAILLLISPATGSGSK